MDYALRAPTPGSMSSGAPMGRRSSYRGAANVTRPMKLLSIPLVDAYDEFGTYWGLGQPLFWLRNHDDDDENVDFETVFRASDSSTAVKKARSICANRGVPEQFAPQEVAGSVSDSLPLGEKVEVAVWGIREAAAFDAQELWKEDDGEDDEVRDQRTDEPDEDTLRAFAALAWKFLTTAPEEALKAWRSRYRNRGFNELGITLWHTVTRCGCSFTDDGDEFKTLNEAALAIVPHEPLLSYGDGAKKYTAVPCATWQRALTEWKSLNGGTNG